MIRILGIDPGLRRTGWGLIQENRGKFSHIAHGTCLPEGGTLSDRLADLHRQLINILAQHRPDEAAIEETFVNKNLAGSLKLGHARGVAMAALGLSGVSVAEYAPNRIKKALTGAGHAEKHQILYMLKMTLPGAQIQGSDAADALATAICHAWYRPQPSLARALAKQKPIKLGAGL